MAKVLPEQKIERDELNLRLGIKSSLPKVQEFLGTYLSFYLIYDDIDSLDYSEVDGNSIEIKRDVLELLDTFFVEQLATAGMGSIEEKINNSPFLDSQIEALQVALELYWKLAKINFRDGYSENSERTGGNRYPKVIHFSTNANILKNILSNDDGAIHKNSKDILFNWIVDGTLPVKDTLENKLLETLTIFSEETQVKIKSDGEDLVFQQESIYQGISEGNSVESKGENGPVGPFRIMKKVISSSLHPYIQDHNSEFKLKDSVVIDSLKKYKNKVSTYLDLLTRRTIIENDLTEGDIPEETDTPEEDKVANNIIYFGSPGTGKSNTVDALTMGSNVRKITFHTEYDYHSFVGGYKPSMNGDDIVYKFVPQIFTKIYIEAWRNPTEHYYLQIEEINRGNCAEIFGDLFQLLDRDSDGSSKYDVDANEELLKYLTEKLGEAHDGIVDGKIKIPKNLSIIATMNTSDQSLFPMDSAFKRRWDWEYMKIDYDCAASSFIIKLNNGNSYEWLKFLKAVNKLIFKSTGSPDKQIGNWFINATDTRGIINEKTFINKVLFYLWNDVFKDEEESLFDVGEENHLVYEDLFTR
ncbi:MAG: AAA family ATPase, partial [Candidatus Cloacimonadota bacterium]|nr:AAA family ATPase [Candidatus Cloacimonadota bacterium]